MPTKLIGGNKSRKNEKDFNNRKITNLLLGVLVGQWLFWKMFFHETCFWFVPRLCFCKISAIKIYRWYNRLACRNVERIVVTVNCCKQIGVIKIRWNVMPSVYYCMTQRCFWLGDSKQISGDRTILISTKTNIISALCKMPSASTPIIIT